MKIQTDLIGAKVLIVETDNPWVKEFARGKKGTIRSVYFDDGAIAYTVEVRGTLVELWSWAFTVLPVLTPYDQTYPTAL